MREQRPARGKRIRWPIIYGIVLTLYAAFTLLDAFVIPRDIVDPGTVTQASRENPTEAEASTDQDMSEEETMSADTDEISSAMEPVVTENSYTSENISITITVMERQNTQVYVADVVLKDASCLQTGVADGVFGRNVSEKTSTIAEENNAILAINGDYYGFRNEGYVMRNGYLYRDTVRDGEAEAFVIYKDGSTEIVKESEQSAEALSEAGAVQIFSFGPGLVKEGQIAVSENSEVEQAMRSNPRTAIGVIEPLHYLFVVSDGRTAVSEGLSLWELAELMQDLGCESAYNLDGGGSSTMWFMGEVINRPTSHGGKIKERSVSDIVFIGE